MNHLKVVESPSGYFTLGGDLDRDTVPKCWSDGLATMKRSATLNIIDMKSIEHCDTAGLAWLINMLKDCRQQNIELALKNVPDTLINLAKISDVERFLPLQ